MCHGGSRRSSSPCANGRAGNAKCCAITINPAAGIRNTERLLFFLFIYFPRRKQRDGAVLLVYGALLLVELRVKPMGVLLTVKKKEEKIQQAI